MIINWEDIIRKDKVGDFYNGGWVKRAISVDMSKSNGYAFEGSFINNAKDGLTECGDGLYIVCSVEGSRKNQMKHVAVYEITGENVIKVIDTVKGNDWALQIKNKVNELLTVKSKEVNELEKFSTEQLVDELKRRKIL